MNYNENLSTVSLLSSLVPYYNWGGKGVLRLHISNSEGHNYDPVVERQEKKKEKKGLLKVEFITRYKFLGSHCLSLPPVKK